MKRWLSLLLCTVLLMSCMSALTLAQAADPVELELLLNTNQNYNHSEPDRDNSVFEAIEQATNTKLNITWIAGTGAAEKISALMASNDLPDMFSPNMAVANLVQEGAVMALDPYLDKIPNYMNRLPKAVEVAQRNVEDGLLYNINMLTDYSPAYTMMYRQDWLDNLGITETPVTIDQWIEVWKAIRDNDANKNGDPNDEIPFIDPGITAGYRAGYSLLTVFGIKSNGLFYYTDEGEYNLIYEHENFREFLELVCMLYSEKLMDQEVFTIGAVDTEKLFHSNVGFSAYQWISLPPAVINTLTETLPEVYLAPTVPIVGKDGAQLLPARGLAGSNFVFSYEMEDAAEKLEAALGLINYAYSDEGVFLANWGIEGKHHNLVDGKPVLMDEIVNDSSFKSARYAGLACQLFPGVWTAENYNQVMTNNKSEEEMAFSSLQMYKGTTINWDYYFTVPPTLNTPAYVTYNADIMPKINELYGQCVTGKITVDEFFAGYEALKPYGLQEIIDEAQDYYTRLSK